MLSATGPLGGPLPDCGMVFPGTPQATGQAASAGQVSFADAFAALVADLGGSQPAAADADAARGSSALGSTTPGSAATTGVAPEHAAPEAAARPAADTPLDLTRAGDEEQDSVSEDLEAEFVVSLTAPLQFDARPLTVPLTLPILTEPEAADPAAGADGGEDAPSAIALTGASQPAPVLKGGTRPETPSSRVATPDLPDVAEAPASAPAPHGQSIAREVFSPAESPAPVDLPDDGHAEASRRTADPVAAARESDLARSAAPEAPSARASAGAPAANTPAAEARPASARVAADLVTSVQTDAATAETVTSGAALADGEGSGAGSSGSPDSDPEAGYTAPSGTARRFGRVEDMMRELDRQAAESPASSRPVTAEARTAGARLATPGAIAQAPAPAAAPADVPRENIAALVQGIRVQLRQGISEATVRLQPEHFGEVTIAVRLEKGMVSAHVHAEAAGVCDWLTGQEESIRSNLSEHGLQLERFVVQRDRPRERRETPQQPNRPRGRREPDGEQPRFEVAA